MQSLLLVKSFAAEWHQGKWRARDLPEAVGAEIVWERGGRYVLGCATLFPDGSEISLNTRIRGTVLEWPVVLHESAHIIQGHLLGFCGNAWAERQCERDATYGSALLAIPTESAVLLARRRASVRELADYYEVPRALVYMRGALAVVLGEVTGNPTRARASLTSSRRSLDLWQATVARGI